MSNSLDPSSHIAKKQLENESEKTRLRHDLLKHVFSNHTFAFILIFIICVSGSVAAWRWDNWESIKSFWLIITPLISTYIGFAIGGSARERS